MTWTTRRASFGLGDAKTGPRMVPLTEPVSAVLADIRRESGSPWVIVGQKPSTRLSSLRNYWHSIREKAGVDDVRLHDCRHSYASRALALGEGLPTIGKLLGHRKIATTARYAHLMRDAEKVAQPAWATASALTSRRGLTRPRNVW